MGAEGHRFPVQLVHVCRGGFGRVDSVSDMKTTRYFEEQVLRKRPYIKREWCEKAIRDPIQTEIQPGGRIRHWVFIDELGRYLRVVTLEDGKTVHNAFPDRGFKPKEVEG